MTRRARNPRRPVKAGPIGRGKPKLLERHWFGGGQSGPIREVSPSGEGSDLEEKIDIGRTISRGFEVIGAQFPFYVALSLLLAGLPAFASSYLLLGEADPAEALAFFLTPFFWGATLIGMVSGALLQAAVIRSSLLTLNGRPADLPGSLAGALKLILPLVGLSILSSIIITVGFLLLIVPGIIAYCALSVAVPALVEERTGVIGAMERSAALTRGSRWRIFLLLLLFLLLYVVLIALTGGAAAAVGVGNPWVQAGADAVGAALTALLAAGMVASLYVELRTVKEGATTDSLAAIFE